MKDENIIDLEELLAAETEVSTQVTIERIEGDEDSVRVTPYNRVGGCLCSAALRLPKSAIKSVRLTGETHYCCGKALKVVEPEFDETSGYGKINDILAQLAARTPRPTASISATSASSNRPLRMYPELAARRRIGGSPTIGRSRAAFRSAMMTPDFSETECEMIYNSEANTCQWNSPINDDDYETCMCGALNRYHICMGLGPIEC